MIVIYFHQRESKLRKGREILSFRLNVREGKMTRPLNI
jgi:hypothetical protein